MAITRPDLMVATMATALLDLMVGVTAIARPDPMVATIDTILLDLMASTMDMAQPDQIDEQSMTMMPDTTDPQKATNSKDPRYLFVKKASANTRNQRIAKTMSV